MVLDPARGEVLLHRHRRLDRWLQPGGHIEPGEEPPVGAIRETVEETGFRVRHPQGGPMLVHVDEHPGPDDHIHLDLRYLLLADSGSGPSLPAEDVRDGAADLRWLAPDELAAVADRSLLRAHLAMLRRVRAGIV